MRDVMNEEVVKRVVDAMGLDEGHAELISKVGIGRIAQAVTVAQNVGSLAAAVAIKLKMIADKIESGEQKRPTETIDDLVEVIAMLINMGVDDDSQPSGYGFGFTTADGKEGTFKLTLSGNNHKSNQEN